MDQPATPPILHATESAPRCGGGDLGDTKGLNAAGPGDYCGSLYGRLEAGPGGGPASCCLEISPFRGGTDRESTQYGSALNRSPGPQRRTGSAKYRAADGPPFLLPRARGVGWPHEGIREAQEARQEGRAEVAQGEADREEGQEARQQLYRLAGGRRLRTWTSGTPRVCEAPVSDEACGGRGRRSRGRPTTGWNVDIHGAEAVEHLS